MESNGASSAAAATYTLSAEHQRPIVDRRAAGPDERTVAIALARSAGAPKVDALIA